MEGWILEIETKNTIKKIKNPRKVRIRNFVFFGYIDVMDTGGEWHYITMIDTCYNSQNHKIKQKIENAIKSKTTYVNIENDLYYYL